MKTTTIDDLRGLLDGLERQTRENTAAEARLKSFEATLHEISAVLADMLELMQKKGEAAAPPPAPLDLAPLIEKLSIPAPAITVTPAPVSAANGGDWRELKVSVTRDAYGNGPMTGFTIKKVK